VLTLVKAGSLFFTVNREEKIMDGKPIRFADYPWSPDDEVLVEGPSKFHQFIQPQNRMLMRLARLAECARPDTSR